MDDVRETAIMLGVRLVMCASLDSSSLGDLNTPVNPMGIGFRKIYPLVSVSEMFSCDPTPVMVMRAS